MFEVKAASVGGSSRWMLEIKNRCAESRSSKITLAKRMEFFYIEQKKKKGSKNALAPIFFTKESVVGIRRLLKHKTIMSIDPTTLRELIFARTCFRE